MTQLEIWNDIGNLLAKYKNRHRTAATDPEIDANVKAIRLNAYNRFIADLEALFAKAAPQMKLATIRMKFAEGTYPYGTYDYNTPEERARVNELAMKIREERGCEVDIKVEDLGGE